ncbi:hypothetical protein, partial [Zoogloea sp. LCSB751]|uniref:hypothetical protein n=1 Tax=Zoogloea sp. LCSB751 TaxID=1965277 RepID=UPI001C1FD050
MSNTVYNANNQQLNFDSTNVLNIVGNGKGNGDVVRFNSVITIGGQAIDAVVTTTLSGASVNPYDGTSAAPGQTAFFQPDLNVADPGVGGIGGVRFKIDFYKSGTFTGAGTGQAVTLQNVVVNSYDIDSTSSTSSQRQFQDFKGFAQYELATATQLTATVQSDGSVRFQYSPSGSPTNNGTYSADGYRVKVYYDSISSFELLTGATKAASGTWNGTAYFALDFSVGPNWTGATTLTGTPSANVSYSSGTFTEGVTNDGSISNAITLTLANDTYASDVVSSNRIVATNVPAGLTATFVRNSNTVITATLTGNASAHANANDINNLTFSFQNGAFVTHATAADVTGFTKGDLIVNFNDPSPALGYSTSTFTEAVANDGAISNTVTITLTNDT